MFTLMFVAFLGRAVATGGFATWRTFGGLGVGTPTCNA
jgi:hypothetical protein